LLRAVAAARGALPDAPLIVVIGASGLRVRAMLTRAGCRVRIVTNARWRDGMATSLRAGIDALPPATRAALVLLADQPRVGTAELVRLLRAWRRRPGLPAAAHYDDRLGAPAIIPRRTWRVLDDLHGDEGARSLLRADQRVTLVALPKAAFDVDTPADLEKL
jgi:CTP:molybdopterin cytidylyltransferase MocA